MDKKISEIRKISKDICDKNGTMDWEMHVMPVLKNAMELAGKLKADKEVVEISVCLHDIARLSGSEEDHHIAGSKMAAKILKKLGYPKPFIEKVEYCVLNHGALYMECKTLESKIVNSADAMAHLETPLWLVWIAGVVQKKNFRESFEWVDKKIENGWKNRFQLSEAREMARPKYEAAKIILDSTRRYLPKGER